MGVSCIGSARPNGCLGRELIKVEAITANCAVRGWPAGASAAMSPDVSRAPIADGIAAARKKSAWCQFQSHGPIMALSWTTRLCPLGDDLSDSAAEPVVGMLNSAQRKPGAKWRNASWNGGLWHIDDMGSRRRHFR